MNQSPFLIVPFLVSITIAGCGGSAAVEEQAAAPSPAASSASPRTIKGSLAPTDPCAPVPLKAASKEYLDTNAAFDVMKAALAPQLNAEGQISSTSLSIVQNALRGHAPSAVSLDIFRGPAAATVSGRMWFNVLAYVQYSKTQSFTPTVVGYTAHMRDAIRNTNTPTAPVPGQRVSSFNVAC